MLLSHRVKQDSDEYERGKATGIDGIQVEILKNLTMHNLLYEMITKSYETGDIPEEFVKSRTIVLSKKEQLWNVVIIELFPYYHMLPKFYL